LGFCHFIVIVITIKGGDYKGEKKLLIANGEGEFDKDVFVMGNKFKIKYEQLHQIYNGGQCIMVLIKNVTITFKGNQFLKTQTYKIFTKVIDEGI
jgi:hypothetical protein